MATRSLQFLPLLLLAACCVSATGEPAPRITVGTPVNGLRLRGAAARGTANASAAGNDANATEEVQRDAAPGELEHMSEEDDQADSESEVVLEDDEKESAEDGEHMSEEDDSESEVVLEDDEKESAEEVEHMSEEDDQADSESEVVFEDDEKESAEDGARSTANASAAGNDANAAEDPASGFSPPANGTAQRRENSNSSENQITPDFQVCYNKWRWPRVKRDCGGCKALVNIQHSNLNCATYCSSFGLTCAGAWEDRDDTCQVLYPSSCQQQFFGTSDAICECRPRRRWQNCPSFWPDLKRSCGRCRALVNIQRYGSTCDGYCSSAGLRCTGAWEEQSDNCVVKQTYSCGSYIPATSDAICQCEYR